MHTIPSRSSYLKVEYCMDVHSALYSVQYDTPSSPPLFSALSYGVAFFIVACTSWSGARTLFFIPASVRSFVQCGFWGLLVFFGFLSSATLPPTHAPPPVGFCGV